jgi:hypothetical protein
MRAWVVFDREGNPVSADLSEEQAKDDAAKLVLDYSWGSLEGLGYTCQLCIIHPIPVEQLEREEEKQ